MIAGRAVHFNCYDDVRALETKFLRASDKQNLRFAATSYIAFQATGLQVPWPKRWMECARDVEGANLVPSGQGRRLAGRQRRPQQRWWGDKR
jgi:hypothetical protein